MQQQLADAKADLEEAEYAHSIEVSENALNAQLEAYEQERNDEIDTLRESLNDKEAILAESFNTVKAKASLVGQGIATIATSLMTLHRCFEETRVDIYSFLTTTMAEAFQCVFLFDSYNSRINIYSEDTIGTDTDIYVTQTSHTIWCDEP